MSVPSYELTRLDSNNFEHLANALAIRVLGPGVTGFGPGADGGRDGFFEGSAPYPSETENWAGTWYIQSKFHPPHLSTDPQKWLLHQIGLEIAAFKNPSSKRKIPNIWIVATNIEPSGVAETGCFDAARALVKRFSPALSKKFHIWGGRKILDLLADNPRVADYYGSFLTPGHVLKELYENIGDGQVSIKEIIRHLTVTQMIEQQYTKLEQAGSPVDNRPGIQRLFTDIPFRHENRQGYAARSLAKSIAQVHKSQSNDLTDVTWKIWNSEPERARSWFVKGGPGQGKSTLTQYMAQIQRAALVLGKSEIAVTQPQREVAQEIRSFANKQGLWPEIPRIPITLELKDYAFWFGQRSNNQSRRAISYLADKLSMDIGAPVQVGTLKRAFSTSRWLFIFDGLDEVPSDVKDLVADETIHFVEDALVGCDSDAMIVCTSRPQGYSGQFKSLAAATIVLSPLSRDQALRCATPLLKIDRSESDSRNFVLTLQEALKSPAIAEIMTTPLQAHIMAVIVRDGGKPPERKWKLFNTFYEVIKKREATRNLPDKKLGTLLRQGDKLLRALHNRLGFELHARAETSKGATTAIPRQELHKIVTETVKSLQQKSVPQTVSTLMKATTERLVLVNTPESGENVRFDIRPLQEFFAAEYLYRHIDTEGFRARLATIAPDSHWREVMHFLISALVENGRSNELSIAVNILEELDSGAVPDARVFNRRACRGASVTARLLAEGVLEEDMQIRGRFLNSIMPIAGQTHPAELLGRPLQAHSLDWLQEALVIAMKELPSQETLGAATLLAEILPDKDKRADQVREIIWGNGLDFVGTLLKNIWSNIDSDRPKFPRWLIKLAVDLLTHANWNIIDEELMHAATAIIGSNNKAAKLILGDILGPDLREIIIPMISTEFGSAKAVIESYSLHGGLEIHAKQPHPDLDFTKWSDEIWNDFETAPGIIFSIGKCFRFLRDRNDDAWRQLIASVGGRHEKLVLLPPPTASFLRDRVFSCEAEELISIDDAIEEERAGWYRMIMMGNSNDSPDWSGISFHYPSLFFYLANTYHKKNDDLEAFFASALNEDKILSMIRSHCKKNLFYAYSSLRDLPFPTERFTGWIMDNVRLFSVRRSRYGNSMHSFELMLPAQADLLPHVVGAMLDKFETPRQYLRGSQYERESLSAWANEFCPKAGALKKIWAGSDFDDATRVAALILYLLHPNSGKVEKLESLVERYSDEIASWMLPGIGYGLMDKLIQNDAEALKIFNALLEKSSTNLGARASLGEFFKVWREVSGSPVTSSRERMRWS